MGTQSALIEAMNSAHDLSDVHEMALDDDVSVLSEEDWRKGVLIPDGWKEEKGPWINSLRANFYFGGLIIFNGIIIGAELQFANESLDNIWWILDNFFTFVFLVEAVWRIYVEQLHYFRSLWNLFDLFLVVVAVVDTWILPNSRNGDGEQNGIASTFNVLRIFRLARLLRLARLFKLFPELADLIHSMAAACRGIFWILVLLVIIIYVVAIFIRTLVDDYMINPATGRTPDVVMAELSEAGSPLDPRVDLEVLYDRWGNLIKSMYTLIVIFSADEWNVIVIETSYVNPHVMFTVFVPYVVFCNIVLMNLLIGLIADRVLGASEEQVEARRFTMDEKSREICYTLFGYLDRNRDRLIDREDMVHLQDPGVIDTVEALGARVSLDLTPLLDCFPFNDDGELDPELFCVGMQHAARRANSPEDLLSFLKSALHSYFKLVFDVARNSARMLDSISPPRR